MYTHFLRQSYCRFFFPGLLVPYNVVHEFGLLLHELQAGLGELGGTVDRLGTGVTRLGHVAQRVLPLISRSSHDPRPPHTI